MSARNSSVPSESLPQQDVSGGDWALNAYSPVFWCPYREAACSEGSAITTTSSPCTHPNSQSGYFCQNMHGSSSFLDYTSRQVEQCQWYKQEYFPVAAILSSCSLILLLYVSCWKVCKLERPKSKKLSSKESSAKKPDESDVENNQNETRSSTAFVLNCCGTKLFIAKEGIQEAATAPPAANGNASSKPKGSMVSQAFSYVSSILNVWKPQSSSSSTDMVMSSWKKIEWLSELHVVMMSLQITSTLPASLYTSFPPLTSHVLRLFGHASLATPLLWPFTCLSGGYASSHILPSNAQTTSQSSTPTVTNSYHFWNVMALTTTVPLLLVLCCTCLYVFLYELYFLASADKRRRRGQMRLSTWYFTSCVSGYQMVIGSVAALTMGSLHCVDVDPDHTMQKEDSYILWHEPSLVCHGSGYTYYRVWAIFAILIYLVFFPMLCGAAIRCWRCTISVIVNHAHRFKDPGHEAHLTKTLDDGGDTSLRLPGRPTLQSSTSSSSSLSTQSSYFMVTGGDDVAKLQLENDEDHSGDEEDPYESDDVQLQQRRPQQQRRVLTGDTAATKPSVVSRSASPEDRGLVSVKVSRTVRAAAILYTNFRQQYKYGMLGEVFVRVLFMGVLPNVAQPQATSTTQALLLPFLSSVGACFLWLFLLKCRPYRRPAVQRLAELVALQVLLLSLGAMLLQAEATAASAYAERITASGWLALDVALVLVLLTPLSYYLYGQYRATQSDAQGADEDDASISSGEDNDGDDDGRTGASMGASRRTRRLPRAGGGGSVTSTLSGSRHRWTPEYEWLRSQFQRSHGLGRLPEELTSEEEERHAAQEEHDWAAQRDWEAIVEAEMAWDAIQRGRMLEMRLMASRDNQWRLRSDQSLPLSQRSLRGGDDASYRSRFAPSVASERALSRHRSHIASPRGPRPQRAASASPRSHHSPRYHQQHMAQRSFFDEMGPYAALPHRLPLDAPLPPPDRFLRSSDTVSYPRIYGAALRRAEEPPPPASMRRSASSSSRASPAAVKRSKSSPGGKQQGTGGVAPEAPLSDRSTGEEEANEPPTIVGSPSQRRHRRSPSSHVASRDAPAPPPSSAAVFETPPRVRRQRSSGAVDVCPPTPPTRELYSPPVDNAPATNSARSAKRNNNNDADEPWHQSPRRELPRPMPALMMDSASASRSWMQPGDDAAAGPPAIARRPSVLLERHGSQASTKHRPPPSPPSDDEDDDDEPFDADVARWATLTTTDTCSVQLHDAPLGREQSWYTVREVANGRQW